MIRLFAVFVAGLLGASVVHAEELLVLTEEFKPYQYEDENGRPTGFMVELVGTILEESDIDIEGGAIRIHPWAEAYDLLLDTENAAAFMTVRTEEREDLLKWVGPLAPRETWLYKLKARDDIDIATLDDAKAYKVGGYRSAQTDYLLELGFEHVDIASQESANVERLLNGDVDLVPSLPEMMAQRLGDLGASYDTVEKVVLLDGRYDYYLALNPGVADEIVEKLQAALDEAKGDGTYARLEAEYLGDAAGAVSDAEQQ